MTKCEDGKFNLFHLLLNSEFLPFRIHLLNFDLYLFITLLYLCFNSQLFIKQLKGDLLHPMRLRVKESNHLTHLYGLATKYSIKIIGFVQS